MPYAPSGETNMEEEEEDYVPSSFQLISHQQLYLSILHACSLDKEKFVKYNTNNYFI
jgi:hypothetical protein